MVRYERHMAGVRMGKAMLEPREDRKPYVYRPLKNPGTPMPDQGLVWIGTTVPWKDQIRFTVYK